MSVFDSLRAPHGDVFGFTVLFENFDLVWLENLVMEFIIVGRLPGTDIILTLEIIMLFIFVGIPTLYAAVMYFPIGWLQLPIAYQTVEPIHVESTDPEEELAADTQSQLIEQFDLIAL